MTAHDQTLQDSAQRATAILAHDRSLLVEAGAGSGKTALMAGRIAMLLASGASPGAIAAVTFTELAASELLSRVRQVVTDLLAGTLPKEIETVLPQGLSEPGRDRLQAANARIEEITCTTIHGFCQRLIKPYPVEADIDPGASVMGRDEAEAMFDELTDAWLRNVLSRESGGLVAEMVLADPQQALETIRSVARSLRHGRPVGTPATEDPGQAVAAFGASVEAYRAFMTKSQVDEPETEKCLRAFEEMCAAASQASAAGGSAALVGLVRLAGHGGVCKKDGGFYAYRKKTKWQEAAKRAGLSKSDALALNDEAERCHDACCRAWERMRANAASRILGELVAELGPLVALFRSRKRAAAVLDFDDLIFAARDLLKNHELVRQALARRYAHVLVDEFQDTDPVQTEIFWRLCGDPAPGRDASNWETFARRPGALFLVGDPKQAIYRFRGADVAAYLRARDAIRAQSPSDVISISTNFRSCGSILAYVNRHFENVLAESNGQPGFIHLHAHRADHSHGPCVAALDVAVPSENGKASAEMQRDAEAEAVAELCRRLVGRQLIQDHKTGQDRLCRPGDIALLAPSGTELWRYEEALEQRGVPVATQAGKGFFRRQEVQDLIALTRVLADPRDTLALGALLRGPAVGLTDEELLDIVDGLPRDPEKPDAVPPLRLFMDPDHIVHPLARDVIRTLQELAKCAASTTPYNLLSQAVDAVRLRPTLRQRHHGQAERALANVDLYLDMSRPYAVRGLRAFAEAMMDAWSDKTRALEGRPDAQEESVALYTMHAAKGLEWPVVIPINTLTKPVSAAGDIVDRAANCLYAPIFGVHPAGYERVRDKEREEIERERVRIWYVAATRARDVLVLPRSGTAEPSGWGAVVNLGVAELPAIAMEKLPPGDAPARPEPENRQTRAGFADEAGFIQDRTRRLDWVMPSRGEDHSTATEADQPEVLSGDDTPVLPAAGSEVRGGRDRGLAIHKLLEEALSGELNDDTASLAARAEELIRALGHDPAPDATHGLSPAEIAGCVGQALALPEIAALRPRLVHEIPVYGFTAEGRMERATAGIADAVAVGAGGEVEAVIDWKSDVAPTTETIEFYRAQVQAYLDALEFSRGLIVFVTTGQVIPVIR